MSPQSSQTLLRSARASPQPQSPSMQPQQYFDLPSRSVSPGAANSPRPLSPFGQPLATPGAFESTSTSKPIPSSDVHLVERPDLHKSLKALESLLVNLDEYRDLAARLAKVEKKMAKSASELERTKVVRETPSQTLQVSSTMFEGLAEVSSRHAKHVQKEYEAVNDACAKYFKKVAKEERAHDELVQTLDAKIKKANAVHEKNMKKATGNKALESHDRYIATVQALTNDISRAKNAHARSMAAKSHASSLLVASTIGGLADVEFKRRCESVRRVGPHVGQLNELLCFASSEFMPALQASKLEEAEQYQADYLVSLAAQVEAQVAVQAQINAKINEDTQTILRAQEMGWRPPSPLAPPTNTDASLARSSSINSDTSRVTEATGNTQEPVERAASNSDLARTQSSTNLLWPKHESGPARSDPSSKFDPTSASPSLSKSPEADVEAASVKSVATEQTSRLTEGNSMQTQASPASKVELPGAGLGSVRLDRAPAGSTMKSLGVQPQTRENAPASSSDSAVASSGPSAARLVGGSSNAQSTHNRDPSDPPRQEGSIVDKLSVPREDSEANPPSLSASNSAQGSEDGSRIPRTPDDSESLPSMQSARNNTSKSQLQTSTREPGIVEYRNAQFMSHSTEPDRFKVGASPHLRPAQRALEQYRELSPQTTTFTATTRVEHDSDPVFSTPALSRSDSIYSAASQHSETFPIASPDHANARKISLWERERERMRQLEREEELSAMRTPVSATAELSSPRPLSALYSRSAASSSHNDGGWPRSKMSEGGLSDRGVGPQLGLGYPHPSGADTHGNGGDNGGYAPSVGSTRLSATGVTRSLSTDTTASERSFVARMKARYQAEKDLEREQRELKVLEKERAARRATMDPHLSLPSLGGARGRVPEIASRYQLSGAATYAQEFGSARRYHDSLPTSGHVGGATSRISPNSSVPSGANRGDIDEFGGILRDGRHASALPSSGRAQDPAHSDVCGCHQCSGRHYGNGTTRVDAGAAGVAGKGARAEINVRRTSMPVFSRNESQLQQQYANQQSAYASSPPRRDAYSQQANTYRQQQPQQRLLAPNSGMHEEPRRRSYEDPGSGSDAGSRRVMFAQEPQSIR